MPNVNDEKSSLRNTLSFIMLTILLGYRLDDCNEDSVTLEGCSATCKMRQLVVTKNISDLGSPFHKSFMPTVRIKHRCRDSDLQYQ